MDRLQLSTLDPICREICCYREARPKSLDGWQTIYEPGPWYIDLIGVHDDKLQMFEINKHFVVCFEDDAHFELSMTVDGITMGSETHRENIVQLVPAKLRW